MSQEPWIKEGKYALNWTRLSCHRFVANQVRLLSKILTRAVYPGPQLGELLEATGPTQCHQGLVAMQRAGTGRAGPKSHLRAGDKG